MAAGTGKWSGCYTVLRKRSIGYGWAKAERLSSRGWLLERVLGVRRNAILNGAACAGQLYGAGQFPAPTQWQHYDFVRALVPGAAERFTWRLLNVSGSSAMRAHYGCVGLGLD